MPALIGLAQCQKQTSIVQSLLCGMGKRKKEVTEVMIRDHLLMKMLWAEMRSGLLFKFKGCNVHLSIVFDKEAKELSSHITDEDRDKRYHIAKKNVDKMEIIVKRYLKSSIRRYKPESKYRQFHPGLLRSMGFGKDHSNAKKYDIAPMITALARGKPFRKCLVRDGLKYKVPRPGFILKDSEYYFIMPLDEQRVWVQNLDIRKTPLWDLPTTKGFFAYFAYLEKYDILEKSELLSKENKKKFKGAVLALLTEAGGHTSCLREG